MKKIIIGSVLAIAVVTSLIWFVNKDNSDNNKENSNKKDTLITEVFAGGYRDGIGLQPTKEKATGMAIDTQIAILLDEDKNISLKDMQENFEVEPKISFEIAEDEAGRLIKFDKKLDKDTLYKFKYHTATWLFQTETDFSLIGTLPRNETVNVPTYTGIEFYFSHIGADVEDYFQIEPSVKGKFESFGNTVVFVPKELEPETLYTVTLKKGLTLAGTEEELEKEYIFSFETTYDQESNYVEEKLYANYNRQLNDFSTTEKIYIPFNYGVPYEKEIDKNIETKVYEYDGLKDLVEAMKVYNKQAIWTIFDNKKSESTNKNLREVMRFETVIEDIDGYESSIHIEAGLEPGYYLVKSIWEDTEFQTFIQVSDLSFYYIADKNKNYFWINDLSTGLAAEGAKVQEYDGSVLGETNADGVTSFNEIENEDMTFYRLSYEEKEILAYSYGGWLGYGDNTNYWKYFQTDRNLYKPNDEVSFFGFIQNREDGSSPTTLTLEINENVWWYDRNWGDKQIVPLVEKDLEVKDGFYEGSFVLPDLAEGGYQIQIKDGDETITSYYISIENYIKSDYKITIDKDKEAIFTGENVTYTVSVNFFEGTEVAELPLNYNLYGADYQGGSSITDENGKAIIHQKSANNYDYQGELYGGIDVYATLPESGQIYAYDGVRIFSNDIDVSIEATLDEDKGTIKGDIFTINLDRLNNHTAKDYYDYKDKPVSNHLVGANIIRNEWVKTEVGEYYDFINKKVNKRYDYNLEKTIFKVIELETDTKGHIEEIVDMPDEEEYVHYTVEISTEDLKGKPMKQEVYFGENYYYTPGEYSYLYLTSDKQAYHVDEDIKIELMENEQVYKAEKVMLVFARNGIKDIKIVSGDNWTEKFTKDYKPNVEIMGVIFTGKSYRDAESLYLNVIKEDFEIDLSISLDKIEYKPGDKVRVSFEATHKLNDSDVVPVKDAIISIGLVDESLLALMDTTINPLEILYGWVDSGIYHNYGSHFNMQFDDIYRSSNYDIEDEAAMDMKIEGSGEEGYTERDESIRSDFKDTAIFTTTKLDAVGKGTVTFTLPDNITAWRLSAAALSNNLLAGSKIETVNVSLPFFINPNLNKNYLVGDEPFIGIAAYGSDLSTNEIITYTLTCDTVNYIETVTGKAFKKVNIPMWKLEEGEYEVTITARTSSGLSDGYVENISVLNSYQKMQVSDTYIGSKGLKIESNESGMTNISFAEKSKGMYLPSLYNLYYSSGKRVDQAYVSFLAGEILRDTFELEIDVEEVTLSAYITGEGGVGLFPYSEAVLETTLQLLPYIKDTVNEPKILNYLYSRFYGKNVKNRSKIIYGLAVLGESVLLELNQRASIDNLSLEDYIYIAMAYDVLGDRYMAQYIYEEEISKYVQQYEFMSRVVKESDEEKTIHYTSLLLPLAASLSLEEGEGFYKYVNSTYSETYLTNLDRLRYITIKMEDISVEKPSLKYEYEGKSYQVNFSDYGTKSIKIPSSKIDSFMVIDVTSDILLIVNYDGMGTLEVPVDTSVSIDRHYEVYKDGEVVTRVKQGDIVKVVLDWEIKDMAIDNYYQITDYAPSGLIPLGSRGYYRYGDNYRYRDIDGQQVKFVVYKDKDGKKESLYYYARIVSPGSFIGDAPIIQGMNVKDSYNLGEKQTLVIEP